MFYFDESFYEYEYDSMSMRAIDNVSYNFVITDA